MMIIKLNPEFSLKKAKTEAKIVPIRRKLSARQKLNGDRLFSLVFIAGSLAYTVLSIIL